MASVMSYFQLLYENKSNYTFIHYTFIVYLETIYCIYDNL